MEFDYFYGQQAEMFSFYRIPKVLFTDERYWNVSTDAKLLYGILLDRMNLSAKNGWLDEAGRVYIIFTIEEIMGCLGCADQKVQKMLTELEKKCGLIERKRQGLGKPNLIYVKNFVTNAVDNPVETRFLKSENHDSGEVKITSQDQWKSRCNNTDIKNTEFNDNYPILSSEECGKDSDGMSEYRQYYDYFFESLEIESMRIKFASYRETIDGILELVVEQMCSRRSLVRVASDDKPIEIVRSRMMKLNSSHIEYVMDCFLANTSKVRNIKQYLLAALFNAPSTIDGYYTALVNHDMNRGML